MGRVLGVAAVWVLALTGVAGADVSQLNVDPSTPSNAAGAKTSYVITFQASVSGGFTGSGGKITITFPSGTDLTKVVSSQVFDTTTAPTTQIGSCGASGLVETCSLFPSDAVGGGDAVKVVVNGVINPATAGSQTLTVSTTGDPLAVTSPAYTIARASTLTGLNADPSTPSNAAGARTTYTITFTASGTGGMTGAANSRIPVTFPAGTDLTSVISSQVFDTTVAPTTQIGSCSQSGVVADCGLFPQSAIGAGDVVKVVINGVTNTASAGSKTLTVSTTSDPAAVTSPAFSLVAPSPITKLTVDPSAPSNAAGARTSYVLTFATSSTGGMSGAASSKLVFAPPSGTDITTIVSSQVFDTAAAPNTQIGSCSATAPTVTCGLFPSATIPAGDTVRVAVNGVTSSTTAGAKTLTASTTSDTPGVTGNFTLAGAQQISGLTVTPSSTAGGAHPVTYAVTFTTSSTGGLAGIASSRINVTYPSGTDLTGVVGTQVFDTTDAPNTQIGSCGVSGLVVSCGLFPSSTIGAGHGARVVINGVTNPPGGSATLTVATTSDTGGVPSTFAVSPAPPATGGAGATAASTQTTAPPTATPSPPSVTGTTGVGLSALVNPNGLPTTVHFEYGLDPAVSGAPLTYDSRTADQSLPGDSADHAVTANVGSLVPNATYHVRVVATNSAGTVTGADQTFTTKADAPPPAPVLGEEVNVAVVSGLVFVKLPGAAARQVKGTGFVPLTEARQLPIGTQVDARRGTIRLVAATTAGSKTQAGTFSAALFQMEQSRARRQKGLTTVRLLDDAFTGAPSSSAICKASARAKRPPKAKIVQLLKANVHGRFRSRGRYAAATVRGTSWDMADRCDGTLTVVHRGTVIVTDLRRHRAITVKAGKSYLAKAP